MALTALIVLPLFGGIAALLAQKLGRNAERWFSIAVLSVALVALIVAWTGTPPADAPGDQWLAMVRYQYAPALGLQFLLAMDGLSGALVAVSIVLGIISVVISWNIRKDSGLFHACILWTVAASNGVFLSMDLLFFAFFWELMLVPSFLLISIWGHGNREAVALKFLVFNAVAGIGLLAAIFWMAATAPEITFDAFVFAEMGIPPIAQVWLLLGFSLAFLTKLPAPPFHAWLPDAHTMAPTAGSILLAGLLLKTGAYGLFRFPGMLFPDGFHVLAPYGLALGAFGTIYGAILACGQTDAKRLVAYTSIAHMSIVLMGLAGGVHFAMMGAGVEMIAHAFSASALFLLIGALYDRVGTRDLRQLGGLQQTAPRFAAAFAVFFSAALAMPGTANFLGEALVITGMFQVNWFLAAIALVSLVISVVYATGLLKRIIFGVPTKACVTQDLTWTELAPIVLLATGTLLFGLLPQLLLVVLEPAVDAALAPLARP